MDKQKIVLGMLFFIITTLGFIREFLLSNLTTDARGVNIIEGQIKILQTKDMVMKEKILHAESLSYLNTVSRQEGFTDASYIYLK